MQETLFSLAVLVPVVLMFGWCVWTVNPKHPERLEKLRKKFGVDVDDKK